MNYEIIGLIIVGGISIIAFMKPILEVRSLLTRLEETLKNLQSLMDKDNSENKKEHDVFFKFIRDTSDRLTRIETEHSGNHEGK